MTDFLRSILQTAHNANASAAAAASAPASAQQTPVKAEMRPVDQIQVPPSACAADATASLLALEKQRMIKVEIPDSSASSPSAVATNIPLTADSSKAQRAARRDVVNARRETKRKTMSSPSSDSDECAMTSPRAAVSDSLETTSATLDKSKKIKTGKTTSAAASATLDSDAKSTKKSAAAASSPLSCSSSMLLGAEIDALGEERLRAMEAQLESLDPDSKEAKKKRRLIRNRMSAQLHRERKKAYVGQLEDQLLEKERELKALQDKLAAMTNESLLMKQQLAQTTATTVSTPAPVAAVPAPAAAAVPAPAAAVTAPVVQIEDDVVIKAEPIVDVASAFDATPTPTTATATGAGKDNWDYCFANLDDAEMADVAADDLLRDFDHPFAAYAAAIEHEQKSQSPHHEIHAAKKNIVMVMGMMFSATFFGHSPFFFDVQSGSTFSSYFQANPPKELAQLSMASKIMSSLEKSSWKDFRDIASWTSPTTTATAADDSIGAADDAIDARAPVAASPSAASDITDSSDACDSPAQLDDCLGLTGLETDLIDEFVYPVDDPFAPALADTNWFGDDADDFGQSDVDDTDDDVIMAPSGSNNAVDAAKSPIEPTKPSVLKGTASHSQPQQSITSRLFDKLTALWQEKNQVLLTVLDGKNEVTRRSVADMSAIRKSMENGSLFAAPGAAAAKTSPLANDESVSFLYPLSAFSPAEETDPDVMFLEVSCQMSALSM